MSIDKMNSSEVYGLFEELKQIITQLGSKVAQSVQKESTVNPDETTALIKKLQEFSNQKQFSPEQITELQKNLAEFAACSLGKSFEKMDKEFEKVVDILSEISAKLNFVNVPANFVIRKEHAFSIDFKNSKAAITMIAMGVVIFLSVGWNIWQFNRNGQLKDNDLKYRYVKMQGEAIREDLIKLETVFHYKRNKDSISLIRKRVETFERLVEEQAEKIERARMNATEAEQLQKEVESVKNK